MLLEHEYYFDLGLHALVTLCSWNMNSIAVWAWVLWWPYGFGTRKLAWFGHGCSGDCMVLEHARDYDFSMDAVVTVCSWNTNIVIMLAWMFW